jgi:hypothetical protein
MSKKKIKAKALKARQENDAQIVKMKFKEDKFYNNPFVAHFEKDKIYEVRGGDMIQRWLKRGGEIVQGELEVPEPKPNPSVLVEEQPKQEEAPEQIKEAEPVAEEEVWEEKESE